MHCWIDTKIRKFILLLASYGDGAYDIKGFLLVLLLFVFKNVDITIPIGEHNKSNGIL
jgi:hypothetical protein